MTDSKRYAVASLVERSGKYLVVWNTKFGGWGLPGGKLRFGETILAANARELFEETGVKVAGQRLVYQGWTEPNIGIDGKPALVSVVKTEIVGEPVEKEPGHKVSWLYQPELIVASPFSSFYVKLFHELGRSL
jgi:8-oxo-dGTP pyrophosphatase MutT (NUDIX family)